jgi:hypothetical protein
MRRITLAILLFGMMASAAQAAQPTQATRPVGAGAAVGAATSPGGEFASFGVSLTPPAGWKRVPEGATGMIARWARIGADGKANALLTLEMEPAKPPQTAEQHAAEMSKRGGGTSAASPVAMGGEKTTLVTGVTKGPMSVESLVAPHGKYVYVIAAFGDTPELIPRNEMNLLAKSIKFSELDDPSKHTELRNERFPLVNKFSIIPLATMRPNPQPSPQGSVGISTYNFAAGRPDFIVDIQTIPNQRKVSMADLQGGFPGKLAPGKTLTWTKVGGGGGDGTGIERSVSNTFEAQLGEQRQMTRVALVRLGETDIVLLFFSFATPDANARTAYEKASEQMVGSIEPLTK